MNEPKYQLTRDEHNRLVAQIGEDLRVGIRILAETDERRMEKNTHGYAVLDIETSLGVLRIRDIKIMYNAEGERYFLRWKQWPTGRIRDERREYLDVVGPLDKVSRSAIEGAILEVFHQVRDQAQRGTLARDPETRAKLNLVKERLDAEQSEKELARVQDEVL